MIDAFLVAERLRVQEKQYQDLLNNKVDVLVGTNVPTSQINQVHGHSRRQGADGGSLIRMRNQRMNVLSLKMRCRLQFSHCVGTLLNSDMFSCNQSMVPILKVSDTGLEFPCDPVTGAPPLLRRRRR